MRLILFLCLALSGCELENVNILACKKACEPRPMASYSMQVSGCVCETICDPANHFTGVKK